MIAVLQRQSAAIAFAHANPLNNTMLNLTEIDALAKETLNEKEIRVVAFSEDGSTQEKTVSFAQHA